MRRRRYRCVICGGREGSRPIGAEHLAILGQYGHPYTADDYETMSWRTYSCLTCESTDRDRLYALYVERFLATRSGRTRVLEIAPGAALGPFIRKQPGVDYRSADLFAEGVDDVIDVHDMGIYPDESYDLFVCSHVLEHVDDDRKVMREFRRILAGDGRGILMVPILDIPGSMEKIRRSPRGRSAGSVGSSITCAPTRSRCTSSGSTKRDSTCSNSPGATSADGCSRATASTPVGPVHRRQASDRVMSPRGDPVLLGGGWPRASS